MGVTWGSREGLSKGPSNTMLFSDHHLAKLNPNCHMNYSIIFTEISFSPETSNFLTKDEKIIFLLYNAFIPYCGEESNQ